MVAISRFYRLDALRQTARQQLPQLSNIESTQDHLEAAINWLYQTQDVNESEGSSAGYNLVLGWESPYPETTGYIIPTLYRYASETGIEEANNRATRMAEWLQSIQLSSGAFPAHPASTGVPRVFDTGQILFGLIAAYQETNRDEFKEAAIEAADWLVNVQNTDGSWSEYTYNGNKHSYHTRVSWGILKVNAIHSDERYVASAKQNYEWVLDQQHRNGWFNNAAFKSGESPFLHTIAYTIRGLIEGGIILDETQLIESGKKSADTLRQIQKRNGMLKGKYNSSWGGTWYYCLSGNAQMAIVWLRLYENIGDDDYLINASNTIQFLKRNQIMKTSSVIHGSIPGSYPVFGRYMFLRYPNWGTKFLADAFLSLEQNQ